MCFCLILSLIAFTLPATYSLYDCLPVHWMWQKALEVAETTHKQGVAACILTACSLIGAGVPDSASVQEVIFWQGRTIQMMYHIIGQAMQRAGVQNQHPKDYLSFFCLGQCCHPTLPPLSCMHSFTHSLFTCLLVSIKSPAGHAQTSCPLVSP